ncbi:hypothetical protein RN001_006001 [Aquatica leii]|uniref:PHD finger protein 14 n=1 Tax=Aquatica leii TaxID=1421715 RepID=A0AAN7Q238_9COLE|nr:hypothetical protein RN001_006001 [Aquatica leii]
MTSFLEKAEEVDFIIKTAIERDPKKRRVKPVDTQASILDFDLEESSDDSDFRIEDHPHNSDDDDSLSLDSNAPEKVSSEEDDDVSDESDDIDDLKGLNVPGDELSVADVISQAKKNADNKLKFDTADSQLLICCGCLGDQSDGVNELIECDSCGITVHEACYGVSDTGSTASTDSLSPTAPWFCEACKAGVTKPTCELCPNSGGIFKETDVGKWVHLVCALYVPGVAFGEVDRLSSVTLFEMPYNKWGAKVCSLCQDERFARTGVCIGCDAGMCKTYFHVTCAQREGFLSEAHSEEVDQADPFYAHCKLHSDKTLVKKRKRNYLALQLRAHYRRIELDDAEKMAAPDQVRIQRKLEKQKLHYLSLKSQKQPPWVPTQKMPRLLTTSASACRKLLRKAELMGIDTAALEIQEAQVAALVDIRKKWHIPPAFSVEFIAYYLDRNDRLKTMKDALEKLLENNNNLLEEQQSCRLKYDQLMKESGDELKLTTTIKEKVHKLHSAILSACPTKNLPNMDELGKPVNRQPQPMMVPTAAALKMGVGFPLNSISIGRNDSNRVLSSQARQSQDNLLLNECGICRQRRDQHLLAKCDTCHLYYHLDCLNPPLTRLPKKSKLYGWQCSECDKTSDSEVEQVKAPRRSRSRYSRESKFEKEMFTPKVIIKPVERDPSHPEVTSNVTIHMKNYTSPNQTIDSYRKDDSPAKVEEDNRNGYDELNSTIEGETMIISRSSKKRRREKHRSRYSPDALRSSKEHKRKRKKKCLDIENPKPHPRITIKIRPIPLPAGETTSSSNPQCFYVPNENDDRIPPHPIIRRASISHVVNTPISTPTKKSGSLCDVCSVEGNTTNLVSCDDCQKCYHFTCLDPPLKKSPKKRGYSWHCADCDPTASESN